MPRMTCEQRTWPVLGTGFKLLTILAVLLTAVSAVEAARPRWSQPDRDSARESSPPRGTSTFAAPRGQHSAPRWSETTPHAKSQQQEKSSKPRWTVPQLPSSGQGQPIFTQPQSRKPTYSADKRDASPQKRPSQPTTGGNIRTPKFEMPSSPFRATNPGTNRSGQSNNSQSSRYPWFDKNTFRKTQDRATGDASKNPTTRVVPPTGKGHDSGAPKFEAPSGPSRATNPGTNRSGQSNNSPNSRYPWFDKNTFRKTPDRATGDASKTPTLRVVPPSGKGHDSGGPKTTPEPSRGDFHLPGPARSGGQPSMKITDPRKFTQDPGRQSDGKGHHVQKFADRYKSGQLDRVTKGSIARGLKLDDQYRMAEKGDVARRLQLAGPGHGPGHHGPDKGGPHHVHRGRVSADFAKQSFRFHYHGPSYFASTCLYPHWNVWVSWSWGYHGNPLYDPRPAWCRPILYDPAPRWIWWQTPVWAPLPVVVCGTWVDVAPVMVGPRYDVQLLAVRFVDPGHPEQKLGPRYRVWFRNNSSVPVTRPFNVMLLAGSSTGLGAGTTLIQSGVRVTAVEAGDVQSVDVRLPIDVYAMGRDALGNPAPFTSLSVLVDANRELPDISRGNNGTQLSPADVLPIDPVAFAVKPEQVATGAEVLLAGEGFGPEPGRVILHMGGIEMEAEIRGWYDLGVQVAMPNLPLAGATPVEVIVVRGDGAAANPVELTLNPPQAVGPLILAPMPIR